MNFLKKIGLLLVKGASVAGELLGYGPIISLVTGFLPKGAQGVASGVVSDLTLVAREVINAEKVVTAVADPAEKTGAQKLSAAAPAVELILQQWIDSGVLGSKKVKDQAAFSAAAKAMAGSMADLLNSVEE